MPSRAPTLVPPPSDSVDFHVTEVATGPGVRKCSSATEPLFVFASDPGARSIVARHVARALRGVKASYLAAAWGVNLARAKRWLSEAESGQAPIPSWAIARLPPIEFVAVIEALKLANAECAARESRAA